MFTQFEFYYLWFAFEETFQRVIERENKSFILLTRIIMLFYIPKIPMNETSKSANTICLASACYLASIFREFPQTNEQQNKSIWKTS